jgi:hypothetical protein
MTTWPSLGMFGGGRRGAVLLFDRIDDPVANHTTDGDRDRCRPQCPDMTTVEAPELGHDNPFVCVADALELGRVESGTYLEYELMNRNWKIATSNDRLGSQATGNPRP